MRIPIPLIFWSGSVIKIRNLKDGWTFFVNGSIETPSNFYFSRVSIFTPAERLGYSFTESGSGSKHWAESRTEPGSKLLLNPDRIQTWSWPKLFRQKFQLAKKLYTIFLSITQKEKKIKAPGDASITTESSLNMNFLFYSLFWRPILLAWAGSETLEKLLPFKNLSLL
jgi:hypothetical protein